MQKLRGRGNPLNPNYDILFDGFPRSGNTFGSFMLSGSQQGRVKVVTHRHTPPPFLRAAELNRPACLTLRRPLDAITSWIIYTNRPVRSVIRYYLDFHQILLPYRSQFLILPFFVITEDFPLVIQLINLRFGLNLESQFDLEACEREVFNKIDNKWRNESGIVNEFQVARPCSTREHRRMVTREELLHPRYADSLQRCEELYQTYKHEFVASLNHYGLRVPDREKADLFVEKFDQINILGDSSPSPIQA